MKFKGHKNIITNGIALTGEIGSLRWQSSAMVFFGLNPDKSATTIMPRGSYQSAGSVERFSGNDSPQRHQ